MPAVRHRCRLPTCGSSSRPHSNRKCRHGCSSNAAAMMTSSSAPTLGLHLPCSAITATAARLKSTGAIAMNQACGTAPGLCSAMPDMPTSATLGSTPWTRGQLVLHAGACACSSASTAATEPGITAGWRAARADHQPPCGRVTRSTRYGSIITPSLATAAATIAIWSGVCAWPWPKPVAASAARLLRKPGPRTARSAASAGHRSRRTGRPPRGRTTSNSAAVSAIGRRRGAAHTRQRPCCRSRRTPARGSTGCR